MLIVCCYFISETSIPSRDLGGNIPRNCWIQLFGDSTKGTTKGLIHTRDGVLAYVPNLLKEVAMFDIKEELLEDLKMFVAEFAVDHFDKIEDFLRAEADKSDTPIDDLMVDHILQWGKGWLQDFIR